MGFFDSKSKTTSTSVAKQTTQDQQLEDSLGLALSDINVSAKKGGTSNVNLNLEVTDQGAIGGAFDFATRQAEAAYAEISDAIDEVTDFGGDVAGEAFDFGRAALDTADRATEQAVDLAGDVSQDALLIADRATQTGATLADRAIDNLASFGRSVIDTLAGNQAQTTAEITDLADRSIQQVSASTRSDSAEVLNTLTKWVAGAIAIGMVAFAVTRGK